MFVVRLCRGQADSRRPAVVKTLLCYVLQENGSWCVLLRRGGVSFIRPMDLLEHLFLSEDDSEVNPEDCCEIISSGWFLYPKFTHLTLYAHNILFVHMVGVLQFLRSNLDFKFII